MRTLNSIPGASARQHSERCPAIENSNLVRDYMCISFCQHGCHSLCKEKDTKSCLISPRPHDMEFRFWKALLLVILFLLFGNAIRNVPAHSAHFVLHAPVKSLIAIMGSESCCWQSYWSMLKHLPMCVTSFRLPLSVAAWCSLCRSVDVPVMLFKDWMTVQQNSFKTNPSKIDFCITGQ